MLTIFFDVLHYKYHKTYLHIIHITFKYKASMGFPASQFLETASQPVDSCQRLPSQSMDHGAEDAHDEDRHLHEDNVQLETMMVDFEWNNGIHAMILKIVFSLF